jgi:hypothetical protein
VLPRASPLLTLRPGLLAQTRHSGPLAGAAWLRCAARPRSGGRRSPGLPKTGRQRPLGDGSAWQVALVTPLACSNLRWVIGTLPRQTGVYVPRRLSRVSGPVTGASRLRRHRPISFAWLGGCYLGAPPNLGHLRWAVAVGRSSTCRVASGGLRRSGPPTARCGKSLGRPPMICYQLERSFNP